VRTRHHLLFALDDVDVERVVQRVGHHVLLERLLRLLSIGVRVRVRVRVRARARARVAPFGLGLGLGLGLLHLLGEVALTHSTLTPYLLHTDSKLTPY
jgi:hypothetical protein